MCGISYFLQNISFVLQYFFHLHSLNVTEKERASKEKSDEENALQEQGKAGLIL